MLVIRILKEGCAIMNGWLRWFLLTGPEVVVYVINIGRFGVEEDFVPDSVRGIWARWRG